jgi:hypothetical protein
VDMRLNDTWHYTYFIDAFQATDREGKNGLKWLVLRLKRDFTVNKISCGLLQWYNLATREDKETILRQTSILRCFECQPLKLTTQTSTFEDEVTTWLQTAVLEDKDTNVDL